MKFRDWLNEQGGTSLMHGGASVATLTGNNSNMPGIRSKYVAMDREEKHQDDSKPRPELMFGFQRPQPKKQGPSIIDRNRKSIPMRDDDLGITY